MADDLINDFMILDKGGNRHLASTGRAEKGIHLVGFSYHLGSAPARDSRALLLNDDKGMLIGLCLAHLAPVGGPVEARNISQ